jgi:L-ascorbate oxidase
VWRAALLACLASCGQFNITSQSGSPLTGGSGAPDELREPIVLNSSKGILDLLVIAKPATLTQFAPYAPTGLVYEICRRPADGSNECPTATVNADAYGGTRLQLSQGDLLRVHLINRLPANPGLITAAPQDDFLRLNPTNIHLHGMLVSPRYATSDDATWGDNVFVYNFNSANGNPAQGSNLHGAVQFDVVDYQIPIPSNHPSGLYWFHPHVHGITQDQITAGLSGIITVGQLSDYACAGASCGAGNQALPPVRHLILKDTQVLADGTIQNKLRSNFCGGPGVIVDAAMPGQGACAGVDQSPMGAGNFAGGRWYFTVNGQQYPSITLGAPAGQILRIVNASAGATYDLSLWNAAENRPMSMQVISVDGASIDAGTGGQSPAVQAKAAAAFGSANCFSAGGKNSLAVCTTLLHLMPASRAEVWVTYRDANGVITPPPPGATAILRSSGYQAGPGGDSWPAVDLAKVWFAPGMAWSGAADAGQTSKFASGASGVTQSAGLRAANADVPSDPDCTPLASGHKRRIFFNAPSTGANPSSPSNGYLGLGYEELDENGDPVPGTFIDVTAFDPATPTICLPLAAGNSPATETWELVNLSGSDHNFHVHQTHFSVLSAAQINNTATPSTLQGHPVMMDSLPLLHADGFCASVADWRNGVCTAHAATVQITFSIAGDFVYHCHILAHEDGGMMAVIRVRAAGEAASSGLVTRVLSAAGLLRAPQQPATRRIAGVMCRTPPQR